ncbi:tyrosine-type recombinase/integrase, partial [Pseudomonas aeruginosa]
TAVRPGELRAAPWCEFDLDTATWTIPAARMKARRSHVVPLPRQAVTILRQLHELTGSYSLLFPGQQNAERPMSENTINQAIKRLGFDGLLTGHGLRGTFSTALHEMGYDTTLIEGQLSHADPNKTRAAYNHAAHVERRRAMMQDWADYLDRLEQAAPE